ncbi:MAG: transaldolase family protein [Gemmatimonadaceae bacterium]|jgi:transaldolase
MKILLASADIEEVRWAATRGLADGVATTPALLSGHDEREALAGICRAVSLPVYATVGAVSEHDVYKEGRELAKLSDQITVQVPLVEDAVAAIYRLSTEGIRVAATLVFSPAQALLAAKAGASAVSLQMQQLEALGQDGAGVLAEVRAVLDGAKAECEVIAELPNGAARLDACALAGADGVTVTPRDLRALLVHPLTDRGLDQLLHDLSRRPRARTN